MDKVKVFNPQKFDVGVVTLDKPLGFNIKPGSFAMMTEDDVQYLCTICDLFQRGVLRVEEEKQAEVLASVGIDIVDNADFADDEELKKKLSLSAKKLGEWLDTVNERHTLERIYDVAMGMDLGMSKIKLLQAKMPDKEFIKE